MLMLRLILPTLTLSSALSREAVYKKQEAARAGTVLQATSTASRLQCAVRCLREERCTHWTFDMPTRQCRLYPLRSSDSAPRVTETIYAAPQMNIPAGYHRCQGTNKAFGGFFKEPITAAEILERCQLDGASPDNPESETEIDCVSDLIISGYGKSFCQVEIEAY